MKLTGLFLVFLFVAVNQAHAYLDPNTGSGLIAFLVAILAGLIFYGKKIFYTLKNKFKKD
ncbi:MAG: hypothetical protein ACRC9L_01115 [Brevinema sp.]